jgi:hypothetical protein
VARAEVCQEIVDRMPVGSGGVIPAGTERVFCFTRIDGAQGETQITHNWYYHGHPEGVGGAAGARRCHGEPGAQKPCCRNGPVSGWWRSFPVTARHWRALSFSSSSFCRLAQMGRRGRIPGSGGIVPAGGVTAASGRNRIPSIRLNCSAWSCGCKVRGVDWGKKYRIR